MQFKRVRKDKPKVTKDSNPSEESPVVSALRMGQDLGIGEASHTSLNSNMNFFQMDYIETPKGKQVCQNLAYSTDKVVLEEQNSELIDQQVSQPPTETTTAEFNSVNRLKRNGNGADTKHSELRKELQ